MALTGHSSTSKKFPPTSYCTNERRGRVRKRRSWEMPPQRWSRVSFPLRNPESKSSQATKLALTPDQCLKWRFPSTLQLKVLRRWKKKDFPYGVAERENRTQWNKVVG